MNLKELEDFISKMRSEGAPDQTLIMVPGDYNGTEPGEAISIEKGFESKNGGFVFENTGNLTPAIFIK